MKQIISTIVCILASLSFVFGQSPKNIQEPEYIGIFYNVNLDDGTLNQLERQTFGGKTKTKRKLLGFGGVEGEADVIIEGEEKSSIRFAFDQQVAFAVRVESNLIDPSTLLGFFLVEIKDGKRLFSSSKIKASALGAKSTDTQAKAIPLTVYKYGKSSFFFYPTQPLPPGEYVLTNPQTPYVFCFGVDPNPNKPTGDVTPVVGRYNLKGSKSDYFELKPDGTLLLQQDGRAYAGRYDIKDSVITFVITGITSKGEIRGNTIIDPDKGEWIKQ